MKAATCCHWDSVIIYSFQSTPPVKAATLWYHNYDSSFGISIHAAREGGDAGGQSPNLQLTYFNPRRP